MFSQILNNYNSGMQLTITQLTHINIYNNLLRLSIFWLNWLLRKYTRLCNNQGQPLRNSARGEHGDGFHATKAKSILYNMCQLIVASATCQADIDRQFTSNTSWKIPPSHPWNGHSKSLQFHRVTRCDRCKRMVMSILQIATYPLINLDPNNCKCLVNWQSSHHLHL